MEIDVKTITPDFCRLHCPYYDADYQPSDSDYQALYVDGNCLFTEYAIPCQLLDMGLERTA